MYRSEFKWEPGSIAEGNPSEGDGIHAFKSVISMAQYGSHGITGDVIVTGRVELWGDVYEHERGYRASKAQIAAIDDSPDYDAVTLRKLYGLGRKSRKKK